MARFQQFDCKNCGHPIDLERADVLQKVVCPACRSNGVYDPSDHRTAVIHYHQQPLTTGTHPFPRGAQVAHVHGLTLPTYTCRSCNALVDPKVTHQHDGEYLPKKTRRELFAKNICYMCWSEELHREYLQRLDRMRKMGCYPLPDGAGVQYYQPNGELREPLRQDPGVSQQTQGYLCVVLAVMGVVTVIVGIAVSSLVVGIVGFVVIGATLVATAGTKWTGGET